MSSHVEGNTLTFTFPENYGIPISKLLQRWKEQAAKIRIRLCPRTFHTSDRFKNKKQYKYPPVFLERMRDPDQYLPERYHPDPWRWKFQNKMFPQSFRGYSTRKPQRIIKR